MESEGPRRPPEPSALDRDDAAEIAAARARSAVSPHGARGAAADRSGPRLLAFSRLLGGRLVLAVEALADGLDGLARQRRGDLVQHRSDLAELTARTAELEQVTSRLLVLCREQQAEIARLDRARGGAAPSSLGGRAPSPAASAQEPLDPATYVAFEERFRGPRSDIEARQRDALVYVRSLVGNPKPLLDLGAGRGEWLAVLAGAQVAAYGIDASSAMADEARRAGLDVKVGDGLEHLDQLDAGSVSAVTAFHLVEHMSVAALQELLAAAFRAIEPGGLLVLETPDPTNLGVGAASFYLDPTHVRPLHPLLLQFLVGQAGFEGIVVHNVHPVDADLALPVGGDSPRDRLLDTLAHAIFGGQDYVVVARRP